MRQSYHPLHSLKAGSWFKLICGASYQHLPAVRNLALAYSLAGADCIDVAADSAVIAAAREGIATAVKLSQVVRSPLLMVSVNDGEDPHFRKAQFEAELCPGDCPQPCVAICPAEAIVFQSKYKGIVDRLCYGCGRCLPVCPSNLITTRERVTTIETIVPWIEEMAIEAIEIHTQVGHYDNFGRVWQQIVPQLSNLKLIAISCTDHPHVLEYLRSLYRLISPLPIPLIWQTDGRSMSGDIGKGTTHAAIAFARKILATDLPGYVQLAGGTNDYTVTKLEREGILSSTRQNSATASGTRFIAGVAYGSYARSLLSPTLNKLDVNFYNLENIASQTMNYSVKLEQNSQLLNKAVFLANNLVSQLKNKAEPKQPNKARA
ncbi:circadian clock protein LdpA [Myxosarcina sp. GI1]|uniref:circadian clock protein LdpA n=1 Tax=Myxosarcina sp. GI1 TaxID=1541065 RepID=UPI00055A159D|nr:LdpA C-terminal domain-containing domain [Myxosarcina sp. GI1]